ncbi:energy transducer TonB [Pedobacter aquatilis]|uniref:energy transducer TonB n=1 Tax=Pedobacter aquatilis TaxID=351343 RepID=UPI00292F6872|nr:energy transducer TonB [Pedobacter aquatilis]
MKAKLFALKNLESSTQHLYVSREEKHASPVEAIAGDESIFDRLSYPKVARSKVIIASVTIQFAIDKDGNTKNIEITKPLGYDCDEISIQLIKKKQIQQ